MATNYITPKQLKALNAYREYLRHGEFYHETGMSSDHLVDEINSLFRHIQPATLISIASGGYKVLPEYPKGTFVLFGEMTKEIGQIEYYSDDYSTFKVIGKDYRARTSAIQREATAEEIEAKSFHYRLLALNPKEHDVIILKSGEFTTYGEVKQEGISYDRIFGLLKRENLITLDNSDHEDAEEDDDLIMPKEKPSKADRLIRDNDEEWICNGDSPDMISKPRAKPRRRGK